MQRITVSQKPLIELQTSQKYAHITLDMIKVQYDLSDEAAAELLQTFFEYIAKHQNCRRVFRQYFCASTVYSSLTLLKEDAETVVKESATIVLDKNNWVGLVK
jgi:hypothetical protein